MYMREGPQSRPGSQEGGERRRESPAIGVFVPAQNIRDFVADLGREKKNRRVESMGAQYASIAFHLWAGRMELASNSASNTAYWTVSKSLPFDTALLRHFDISFSMT
jgi:hypothetical protein